MRQTSNDVPQIELRPDHDTKAQINVRDDFTTIKAVKTSEVVL